jgi:hypothetical protein
MLMMTKEIERRLPALYSQEKVTDPTIQAKYFTPWTKWTWYVLEAEKQENGDFLFFGYVVGDEKELGYFTLSELTSVRGPFGLKIERDLHFRPTPLSEIKKYHKDV